MDSKEEITLESPATLREVGIHLKSVNEKIDRIENNQIRRAEMETKHFDEIQERFDQLNNSFIGRAEFSKHLERDEDHEARIRLLEKNHEITKEEMMKRIGTVSTEVVKISTMIKTWGTFGALIVLVLQIIEVISWLTHK